MEDTTIDKITIKAIAELHEISPIIALECITKNYHVSTYRVEEANKFLIIVDFTRNQIRNPAQYIGYSKKLLQEYIKSELLYGANVIQ